MSLIILSIPIYFILIAIELIYTWIKQKKAYRLGDMYANIGCGIFEQVTGLFVKVISFGMFVYVYEHWRISTIPNNFFTIFLLWLLVDFAYYWAHRWSHQINLFWVGHVVHHQSEDYNLSVALRQGALQKFFTSPVYLPLALAGFSPEWFLTISALNTLYQFWIHTEFIDKMGWFETIFNTPSHHRVHHGRDPKYIDKNHAGSLIIWDKMFGTFQAEEEKPHYGITRPTQTFNPVKAHLKALSDLGEDLQKAPDFKNKLKTLFYSPGWKPEPNNDKAAPQDFRKFDFDISRSIQGYIIVQFVLLLVFTAFFLFQYSTFNFSLQVQGALFIVLGLISIGGTIEGKTYGWITDLLRWILLCIFIVQMHAFFAPIVILVIGIALFSIIHLIIAKKKSPHATFVSKV